MHIQFQVVQQCIQISTRINSSMYIHTSFVCSSLRVFNNGLLTNNSTEISFGLGKSLGKGLGKSFGKGLGKSSGKSLGKNSGEWLCIMWFCELMLI